MRDAQTRWYDRLGQAFVAAYDQRDLLTLGLLIALSRADERLALEIAELTEGLEGLEDAEVNPYDGLFGE